MNGYLSNLPDMTALFPIFVAWERVAVYGERRFDVFGRTSARTVDSVAAPAFSVVRTSAEHRVPAMRRCFTRTNQLLLLLLLLLMLLLMLLRQLVMIVILTSRRSAGVFSHAAAALVLDPQISRPVGGGWHARFLQHWRPTELLS